MGPPATPTEWTNEMTTRHAPAIASLPDGYATLAFDLGRDGHPDGPHRFDQDPVVTYVIETVTSEGDLVLEYAWIPVRYLPSPDQARADIQDEFPNREILGWTLC